jgi:hypothetical protein
MRKTRKPVLAVLLAKMPGGEMKLFRGTNMEVRRGIEDVDCRFDFLASDNGRL